MGAEAEGVARALQEVLGEIHDCDVLIPRVDRELAALRDHDALALARLSPAVEGLPATVRRAPGRARYRGLETLAAALTARRALLHDAFVKQWSQVIEDGLRPRLEAALDEADPPAPTTARYAEVIDCHRSSSPTPRGCARSR